MNDNKMIVYVVVAMCSMVIVGIIMESITNQHKLRVAERELELQIEQVKAGITNTATITVE